MTARLGQTGVPRAGGGGPEGWARVGHQRSLPPPGRGPERPAPRAAHPGSERACPPPSEARPPPGPAVSECRGPPAPVPVAPLPLHLDFPTTGGNSPASAGGRRNWKTPAAPLPPADLALIQFNGEIVSPKPNNQPENPRPGASDTIFRFWHPSRLRRSNRVPGSQAPVAQRVPARGSRGERRPPPPRCPQLRPSPGAH